MTFVYGTGTNGTVGDNGNLQSQTITVPTLTNTQSYAYDGVNRLSTFTEAATVLQGYSYDSAGIGYGNRWISSGTFIPYSTQTPQSNNFTNNRWASGTNGYDAAGNQTSVFLGSGGTRSFTYDAENRQITASIPGMSAISYVYDGEGRRVQKTVGSTVTTFVYDAAGNLTAEYGPPSSVAGTTYLTADHLGSTRLVTNSSGAAIARYDYAPFGEELTAGLDGRTTALLFSTNQYPTVTPDGTDLKFTSKERDAETGLDFFLARYYSGAQGRFTGPDWSEKPEPLPYAKLDDPQSLNLYVYVRNNPLNRTDPDGHEVDFDKNAKKAEKLLLKNVSKAERKEFQVTKNADGKSVLSLKPGADANFKGTHTEGYDRLTTAINSDKVETLSVAKTYTDAQGVAHDVSKEYGGGVTFMSPNGNSTIYVSPSGNPYQLTGTNGQQISDPQSIIMGHETLGHGLEKALGGDTSQHRAIEIENDLRREQKMPERAQDPPQ